MPNHVTNRVVITGKPAQLEAFIDKHFVGEDRSFTFESVIPTPDCIKATSEDASSNVEAAYEALTGKPLHPDTFGFRTPSGLLFDAPAHRKQWWERGVTTLSEARTWMEKNDPASIAGAKRVMQALEETGHPTWYEWNKANWGTKWDAYGCTLDVAQENGRLEFCFDTAWSPPEPVFETLAEMWPDLIFSIVAFDEGWNFAYVGSGARGEQVAPNDQLYELVYGRPPERPDDEEE